MVRRRLSTRDYFDPHGFLNSSTDRDSERRYNILKAIDDPRYHRNPFKEMNDSDQFDRSYDYHSISDKGRKKCLINDDVEKSPEFYAGYEKIGENSWEASPNVSIPSYDKSFELGRVKWRGPLARNYINKSTSNIKPIYEYSGGCSLSANESSPSEPAKLLKIRERTINVPPKMMAKVKTVKDKNDEIFAFDASNVSQTSINSMASLTATINDIDAQIKALEIEQSNIMKTNAEIETRNKLYPVIDDVKFASTGWTLQKDTNSREKTFDVEKTPPSMDRGKNNSTIEISNERCERRRYDTFVEDNLDEITTYHETPKKAARKKPLMESTRKSVHSDSTKGKFPTPTRTETTISTITVLQTPDSPDYDEREHPAQAVAIEGPSDTSVPLEVEEFLQNALGDELYNTSVTYDVSESRDRSISQFNASELVSEAHTPWQKKMFHALRAPATEPPPGNSNTMNRSVGIYRSLSQRIKRKFRGAVRPKPDAPSPPRISKVGRGADLIGQLLQEVSVQQTLMNQASKALNVCHTMKEFVESSERVESDRLLLIASLRRSAALEEIKRVSSPEARTEKPFLGEKGEITIKDVNLNLRECFKDEPMEGETVEWFVVVVSQGLKVWATRAMSCPINSLRIDFPEIMTMPNLLPNFKIVVQIYSLKLRKMTYNHEDKYRIRRHRRSKSCPPLFGSPTKLLRKSESSLSPKAHRSGTSKSGCTCFVLAGFVELFLHDLSLSGPWPLMLVAENSILDRTIDLSIACRLHLSSSHEGFLNHGDEAGGFARWNRRWCVLKGHTLMLWNYPRDQESKEPLTVIELIQCVSSKITTAKRTICAKPRTLLIETVRRRNATDTDSIVFECKSSCTIVRNFLSYDSVHELVEWSTKLNHVVMALREWNVIGKARQDEVSDL